MASFDDLVTDRDLRLLVARPAADFDAAAVLAEIAQALEAAGANVPGLTLVEVGAIPRTCAGQTALIRTIAARPSDAGRHEPQ